MDTLSYLLSTIQMRSATYATIRLERPWGVLIPASPAAAVHAILAGECWLQVGDDNPSVHLGPGDVVVLPHGHAHAFRDRPGSAVTPIGPFVPGEPRDLRAKEPLVSSPDASAVVCGHLWFNEPTTSPLVATLPALLHLRADDAAAGWLSSILTVVAAENDRPTAGGRVVLDRLSDVIVIQAIRAHLSALSASTDPTRGDGWLRALNDPQLGDALGWIHQHPERPWTVASLAAQVNMSRPTFAARFAHLVGQPPLTYLTTWRIHQAQRLLATTEATLTQVAGRVGYHTEPAFSRAFKRQTGASPGAYRRMVRDRTASKANKFNDSLGANPRKVHR